MRYDEIALDQSVDVKMYSPVVGGYVWIKGMVVGKSITKKKKIVNVETAEGVMDVEPGRVRKAKRSTAYAE